MKISLWWDMDIFWNHTFMIYIPSWTTKKHLKPLSMPLHSKLKKIQDLHRNLRTFQGKMEFKDFSRTTPKIQGFFKTVRTLCNTKPFHHFFKAKGRTTCNHSNSVLFTCEDNILFLCVEISCFAERCTWYVIGVYNKNPCTLLNNIYISRKVIGKSAHDNPETYCGWF